jgi:hypothetical protein
MIGASRSEFDRQNRGTRLFPASELIICEVVREIRTGRIDEIKRDIENTWIMDEPDVRACLMDLAPQALEKKS